MKESENKNPGIREELQKLGSKLGNKKPAGFEVPEDYFVRLPNAVQKRVLQHKTQHQPVLNILQAKRVWLVLASVSLLIALTFSLLLIQRHNIPGILAEEDSMHELEYLINNPGVGQELFLEGMLESGLTAREIMYDMDYEDIDDPEGYDELMEQMFEKAHYFGIESSYLLSYLD